jgi:hypothetical protein
MLLNEFQTNAELQPFILDGNDGAILDILNRKDISVNGKLSVHDIKQYVSLVGLRLQINDSTSQSCRELAMALEDFKESGFDLSVSYILYKVNLILDDLVAEATMPDFTETHKQTILSFGTKKISRSEQLGLQITMQDVINTRSLLNG